MITALQRMAERKIAKAIEENDFPDLSHWKGKPLPKDDFSNVPDDLRMAYRILKNSGYVPEEVSLRKEIHRIEELLAECHDERVKVKQLKKLDCLRFKLERSSGKILDIEKDKDYYAKVVDRVSVKKTG